MVLVKARPREVITVTVNEIFVAQQHDRQIVFGRHVCAIGHRDEYLRALDA